MLSAGETPLPDEFAGPVDYSGTWLTIALLGLALVAAYYVTVWALTRPRSEAAAPPPVTSTRGRSLSRIDSLADEVHNGRLEPRLAHQELSGLVRTYVEEVSDLPARTMTLADLRARAPRQLADAIAVMYPPEFAPDDPDDASREAARAAFDRAVDDARTVVASWG